MFVVCVHLKCLCPRNGIVHFLVSDLQLLLGGSARKNLLCIHLLGFVFIQSNDSRAFPARQSFLQWPFECICIQRNYVQHNNKQHVMPLRIFFLPMLLNNRINIKIITFNKSNQQNVTIFDIPFMCNQINYKVASHFHQSFTVKS